MSIAKPDLVVVDRTGREVVLPKPLGPNDPIDYSPTKTAARMNSVPDQRLDAQDLPMGTKPAEWQQYRDNLADWARGVAAVQSQIQQVTVAAKQIADDAMRIESRRSQTAKGHLFERAERHARARGAVLRKGARYMDGTVPVHVVRAGASVGSFALRSSDSLDVLQLRVDLQTGNLPEAAAQFRSGLPENLQPVFDRVLKDGFLFFGELEIGDAQAGLTIGGNVSTMELRDRHLVGEIDGANGPAGFYRFGVADGQLTFAFSEANHPRAWRQAGTYHLNDASHPRARLRPY